MYNRELQVIDTQEKAYLLGLFYADGNIGVNKNQCRLSLSLKDKDLIFRLKELFPFFYIHYDRGTKIEMGNYQKELKEDFIANGCLPRKSYENRENLHIPDIKEYLIPHFIRGYFDGDGGCTLNNRVKKVQKRIYIYSASLPLLQEMENFMLSKGINFNTIIESGKDIPIYKSAPSTKSYKDYYSFLYEDATIFMSRKKELFNKILETTFFIQKGSLPCKFCGSDNTVCDGWNYYKVKRQIYLCKHCKRHFTAPLNSNVQSGEGELLEA